MTGLTSQSAHDLYAYLKDPEWGQVASKTCFLYSIKDEGRSNFFEWLNSDPFWAKTFRNAMVAVTEVLGDDKMLVETYPFANLPDKATFCDIGGGKGQMGMAVARKHANMHVILQDLPDVVEEGRKFFSVEYPDAMESNRVDFVPIDFLTQMPVKGQNLYFLRHVIHDWSEGDAIQILKNISSAMNPESRLLIQEFILLERHGVISDSVDASVKAPEPLPKNYGTGNIYPYFQDICMMCMVDGGERTLAEFIALSAAAGLEFVKFWDFGYNGAVEFKLPA